MMILHLLITQTPPLTILRTFSLISTKPIQILRKTQHIFSENHSQDITSQLSPLDYYQITLLKIGISKESELVMVGPTQLLNLLNMLIIGTLSESLLQRERLLSRTILIMEFNGFMRRNGLTLKICLKFLQITQIFMEELIFTTMNSTADQRVITFLGWLKTLLILLVLMLLNL